MLVYQSSKTEFLNQIRESKIEYTVEQNVYNKLKIRINKNEFRSWQNSLKEMYWVLEDMAIPNNSGIAIEYSIPQTSKRVDFIISGYDEKNKSNVVVIELKQWEDASAVDHKDGIIKTYIGGSNRELVHPSYQAWSYANLIKEYNTYVQANDVELYPCAYLHNYKNNEDNKLLYPQYKEYYESAPLFFKGDYKKLSELIKKKIVKGDDLSILEKIDSGKIKPSKSLQNSIAKMLEGNKEFIMIDDQKIIYEEIVNISKKCMKDNKKRTIIVEGGPGTGKSVIAINLLANLTKNKQFVQYVSKNAAPREVYAKKLKGKLKKTVIDSLFQNSGKYVNISNNFFDTLVVDEAHRLNEKSGYYKNLGENQIKEIIAASKCSVFFIDETQKVTTVDIGSISEIEKMAKKEGSEIYKLKLTSQFRCNGSDGYLAWLDNTLEIRETANYNLHNIDYDIKIIDDPMKLKELIFEKNKENSNSRILAGYCWQWLKTGVNDSKVYDIEIGDFKMSWNLKNDIYALNKDSINEVGCIHTTQGLEFEYVGVIIGLDMRYENNKIVTDFTKRAKSDETIKGLKTLYKKDPAKACKIADEIIKNTYKTLMTRGMKGCYIYCVDKNLSEYLKNRL